MNKTQEDYSLRKYVFSRLIVIPLGGFASAVVMLLRALLYQDFEFIPAMMRTLAVDFKSDPPRVPKLEILQIPMRVWSRAAFRDDERALLNNRRRIEDLVHLIEKPNGRLNWLARTGLHWPGLLQRYRGQEAGRVPRLAAFFAALEAREYLRFGRTWMTQLEKALADLRVENSRLIEELLQHGARAASIVDESKITVVLLYGARGGTGQGLSQVLALASRHLAQKLGLDIEVIGVPLTGAYRMDDGTEVMKEGLEYALLHEIEDSMSWNASRSFPISGQESFSYKGPLWDALYRIDATSYRAHMEEAALYHAARVLRLLFFTRIGYEWRKNFGNDSMRRDMTELASLSA